MNKLAIESLSMDLLRTALGYHKGSNKMAEKFSEEALKRCSEIKKAEVKPYFAEILNKIPITLSDKDLNTRAENALMYSIICKNYARKFT
ncbi:MAG: hypothetical protein V1697_02965 [Candidatus Levyibacteriota bacterium]